MSIFLKDILEETKDTYELCLIAGASGLNQSMSWVYLAEDRTNSGFLRKNELIISTAVLYDHTESWLIRFIETLADKHTCGLILNTGKYIFPEDITENIIALCNRRGFPLLTMPWHIHIYDITRDYYDRIFLDMRTEEHVDFYKLLYEVKNTAVLEHYVTQKLGPVLAYDEKHHSNFAQTLYLYLKYWGSIREIAAESYCHRNTISNRISILKNQLGYRLDDPAERFELMAAFMVHQFHQL